MSLSLYKHLLSAIAPLVVLQETLSHRLTRHERRHRLGNVTPYAPNTRVLWLDGASLGEITAAYNIIRLLAHRTSPILSEVNAILFTSSTPHAVRLMAARLAHTLQPLLPHHTLRAHLLPLDSPAAVSAFLRATPLAAALVVESDLWPVLLTETAALNVPLALLDGRLSPFSHRAWSLLAPSLATQAFSSFSILTAQTDHDAVRIAAFYSRGPVRRATSLKFLSAAPANAAHPMFHAFRSAIGPRPVWVAASTHPPDEPLVLEVHRRLRERSDLANALLIVAPRHPGRGPSIARAAVDAGFDTATVLRRAEGIDLVDGDTSVYVADTLGELPLFYGVADVTLIGNSFARSGDGHNFAEAAHFGLCVVHGPHFGAFSPLVDQVRRILSTQRPVASKGVCEAGDEGYIWSEPCMEASDVEGLDELVSAALLNPDRTRELGKAFQAAIRKLRASAETEVLNAMGRLLDDSIRRGMNNR